MTAVVSRLTEPAADAAIAAASKTLQLPTVRAQAGQLAAAAAKQRLSHKAFLAEVLTAECDERDARRRIRLVNEAKFPRTKRLADFDHTRIPDLTPAVLGDLAAGGWIDKGEPLVLLGDSGTGKTHLLIGLGTIAAEAGRRVRYLTCAQLVNELAEAADDKQLTRVLGRYARLDLLCCDLCRHRDYAEDCQVGCPSLTWQLLAGPWRSRHSCGPVEPQSRGKAPQSEARGMSGTRRKPGLLGVHVEGYRAWLGRRGYTPPTVRNMLKELGQVGRWLSAEGFEPAHLSEERLAEFLAARRRAGDRKVPGLRGMRPLLAYLREIGAVAVPVPGSTPLEVLLGQYRTWLVEERGLAEATVQRYEKTARRFLQQAALAGAEPASLTGADVNAFLLVECARVSAGSAKGRVAELRFLFLRHLTPLRLGTADPPVGGWRLATVPPTMTATDVQALLDHCDRGSEVGVRDFAILTLIARLGLRSIEVARLQLGDVDWRAGEILVRGKGRRQSRLPLPTDVGEAMVAYLSHRESVEGDRHLFLTCRAPRGPIRADLVGDVVERACRRAGLPSVGPHRLRHALAAELLRRGASLVAIGQVLRHQDLATTALYAKVDLGALRTVAQPWPGEIW